MSEATRTLSTPTSLDARFVRPTRPVEVTFNIPGKTYRSRVRTVTGRLMGAMLNGRTVHHYRVAATDGVLYLAPPAWLTSEARAAIQQAFPQPAGMTQRSFVAELEALVKIMEARRSPHAEPVA